MSVETRMPTAATVGTENRASKQAHSGETIATTTGGSQLQSELEKYVSPADSDCEIWVSLYASMPHPGDRLRALHEAGFRRDMLATNSARMVYDAILNDPDMVDPYRAVEGSGIDSERVDRILASLNEDQLQRRVNRLVEAHSRRQWRAALHDAGAMDPDTGADHLIAVRDRIRDGHPSAADMTTSAVDYIRNAPPKPDPILEGLFDKGDKAWLIASSKTRKTFTAIQLALSVATGKDWLGHKMAAPRKVLYVQFELKSAHFHRRVHDMARTLGISADDASRMHVMNGRGRSITTDTISRAVQSTGAELVIIDPLYKLHDGDENNAADMAATLGGVDRIMEHTGCAVLIVHHEKKGHAGDRQAIDRGSGSGTIGRDFDCGLYLAPHASERDAYVLTAICRNYVGPDPMTISWENSRMIPRPDLPPVEATSATRRAAKPPALSDLQVMDILRASGPMTRDQLDDAIQRAGSTSRREASRIRSDMEQRSVPSIYHQTTPGNRWKWYGTAEQVERKRLETEPE